jgi:phosphoribosyl-dephospho-CoA transferase
MYSPHKTGHAPSPARGPAHISAGACEASPGLAPARTEFARHDLVWLTDAGWHAARARAAQASAADEAALAQWQCKGWPAITRRRDADLPAPAGSSRATEEVCLGIPLPPDPLTGIKRRVALRARHSEVAKVSPPLPLFSCLPAAGQWQAGLGALTGHAADLHLRTYGSLAMQALTGLPCFTPNSDIDILFTPGGAAQLQQGLELLAHFATRLPLDGEIVFPGACAVSWKEWLSATATRSRVLVKEMTRVHLADPAELLALLEQQ